MKRFIEWLRNVFTDNRQLDINFELAKRAYDAEKKLQAVAQDYAIELREGAENQSQSDIFQQALTNTFTDKRIKDFFDECDRLKAEHKNAK